MAQSKQTKTKLVATKDLPRNQEGTAGVCYQMTSQGSHDSPHCPWQPEVSLLDTGKPISILADFSFALPNARRVQLSHACTASSSVVSGEMPPSYLVASCDASKLHRNNFLLQMPRGGWSTLAAATPSPSRLLPRTGTRHVHWE